MGRSVGTRDGVGKSEIVEPFEGIERRDVAYSVASLVS
jgi:hypothetical protein